MDEQLAELLALENEQSPQQAARRVRFKDFATADLEIERDGQKHTYALKPMNQLFGTGFGVDSIAFQDERFHPILMTIEEAIVLYDQSTGGLTDGKVALTLRTLAMNPEADVAADALAQQINCALRLFLSLNDYSRQEVKLAIRKVLQSVQRHNKDAGVRGYLSFIGEFLGSR